MEGNKSWVVYEHSSKLQKIHEEIITKNKPFFNIQNASFEMLYDGEEKGLNEMTKKLLEFYYKIKSFKHYSPHTTLGCYDAKYEHFPLSFTCDTIAIFHIGDRTTCRKKLFEIKLD